MKKQMKIAVLTTNNSLETTPPTDWIIWQDGKRVNDVPKEVLNAFIDDSLESRLTFVAQEHVQDSADNKAATLRNVYIFK